MVCMSAPLAREEIVRPRSFSRRARRDWIASFDPGAAGGIGWPLNFTVRRLWCASVASESCTEL
jgi:hypothetical protein